MFYRYGFRGRGGMGFGFRGSSPPWPYIGRGRGGLPRCWHPGAFVPPPYMPGSMPYPASGITPYAPPMTQEQELDLLKQQADMVKGQLEDVEARMKDLESEK